MSKIVVDTFEDRSGAQSVAAQYVVQGTVKAWANLNGTGTIALRDSFNISSVTDNGTGDYTHNFTNNFADVNYASTGMGEFPDLSSADGAIQACRARSFVAVGSFRISSVTTNGSVADEAHHTTVYLGDLA